MQTLDTSVELDIAINSIELLLNSKDGDLVLDAIKKYKEHKTIDQKLMLKLQNLYL